MVAAIPLEEGTKPSRVTLSSRVSVDPHIGDGFEKACKSWPLPAKSLVISDEAAEKGTKLGLKSDGMDKIWERKQKINDIYTKRILPLFHNFKKGEEWNIR